MLKANTAIGVYVNPANFKLYMGDVGMLTIKSGISQQAVLTGDESPFLGAIEVKKGVHTQSKSLTAFIKQYQPDRAIRLSAKNFGKAEAFVSIPLYAAFCL
jgi:hypothetical protein